MSEFHLPSRIWTPMFSQSDTSHCEWMSCSDGDQSPLHTKGCRWSCKHLGSKDPEESAENRPRCAFSFHPACLEFAILMTSGKKSCSRFSDFYHLPHCGPFHSMWSSRVSVPLWLVWWMVSSCFGLGVGVFGYNMLRRRRRARAVVETGPVHSSICCRARSRKGNTVVVVKIGSDGTTGTTDLAKRQKWGVEALCRVIACGIPLCEFTTSIARFDSSCRSVNLSCLPVDPSSLHIPCVLPPTGKISWSMDREGNEPLFRISCVAR